MHARTWLALPMLLAAGAPASAHLDAKLIRFPHVSASQITFCFAGDVWVVPKEGGLAQRLSTPAGEESFPRFSPDGKEIAFTATYDGNQDVYVMPAGGGVPARITHHPLPDRVLGWTPDGKSILFASMMESGKDRFNKIFKVAKGGGLPEALPVPYGEFGALSPDGKVLAYMPISTDFRTWKRYRGGMASEIWFYDLEKKTSFRLPSEGGSNDAQPMWHGSTLYFLSDRDASKRNNIWSFDTRTKAFKQITFFKDYDVHFPAIGPSDIVLEAGGRLHRLELPSGKLVEVKVEVVTDAAVLRARTENASKLIRGATPGPQGKRAVFEARGELFSVPAEKGVVLNLTNTPGVAERFPALSADGKQLAYFSDATGEYELWVRPADGTGSPRQVTKLGPGFRYRPQWSPDGKKIVFADVAMRINLCDVETGKVQAIDKGHFMMDGGVAAFSVNWSADSRWITYVRDTPNRNAVVMLYDTKAGSLKEATSNFYNASDAAFDPEGNYLFITTGQVFSPTYSDLDNTWIYKDSTKLAALPLRKDVPSPLAPRNDDVKEDKKEEKKDAKDAKEAKPAGPKAVEIDLDGLEGRMVLLPPPAGDYADLVAVKGKLVYRRLGPQAMDGDRKGTLYTYDLEEREEKTVIADVDGVGVTPDGSKALVARKDAFGFIDLRPDQKLDKRMPTGDLPMQVDAKAEWRQIFNDTWRLERDMFYDPALHGVDWKAMKTRYGKLIDDCVTREDVNFVLGELIAELNASHAYRGGGDVELAAPKGVGLLGADYALENGKYRIKRILRGASWDASAKAPLAQPGVNVKEGDYLLAVNRVPVDTSKDPWAAFQGLAGKTVLLTVNDRPEAAGARDVLVETIPNEMRLRHLAWVEGMRAWVDKTSNGRVGYVYVPDTGIGGQNDLVRQFRGQWTKPGLIIDDRFNSGGQIPDRFVEMLGRKVLNYWGVRDGMDWQWPTVAHNGPKAMLMNGWSGSGGDCFPFYFRQAGLGPLIGRRTWGGLIGISGAPALIDGGNITVPTFGIYSTAGEWLIEGHGVDPDIEVMDDPALMAQGRDPQLERALQEVTAALEKNPPKRPAKPAYPNRAH
ncbi:S41 family peptidase [Mesoterricola sediminis]|uniref:Tricorn protease homolog n=1 Tax=Mesoterricola sediminis TaxID=2927980 RepID=A0AA48H1M0_9BACT|nr:S41 family peptidase [Mesoterricola sediminis]BDU78345.1 tricorn protease [Mesoterricola sediminis]